MSHPFPHAPVLAVVALLLTAGCYPSNVLEESDRAVLAPAEEIAWGPVAPETLPGAWASERIEGDTAANLLEVRTIFYRDGTYTGAGLVTGGANPAYQTLTGTWRLEEGRLILDDAEPGDPIEGGADRLRITSETGTIVMRRIELR